MGSLLSLVDKSKTVDVVLEFSTARPESSSEAAVYDANAEVLEQVAQLLEEFANYPGAKDEIKAAIEGPADDTILAAVQAVCPNIALQKKLYDFAGQLGECFKALLGVLCTEEPIDSLTSNQALVKQFADIMDFALQFDEMKMGKPQMQNDFSFFRRQRHSKNKLSDEGYAQVQAAFEELGITDEESSTMSFFFAVPSPMLTMLVNTTAKDYLSSNPNARENVSQTLAAAANGLLAMANRDDLNDDALKMFLLRGMVASIIIFDHVDEVGAFVKRSPVAMKQCIATLNETQPTPDVLLSILKFSNKHLMDDSTPKGLQNLLGM